MPVYEYACTACGERTEARQSFDDPPLEECPICGGRLRKLFSPVGIVFKGSGFYANDAKKSSSKPSGSKSESTSKSDSASKSDSKDGSSSAGSSTGASDSAGSKDPGSKEKSA